MTRGDRGGLGGVGKAARIRPGSVMSNPWLLGLALALRRSPVLGRVVSHLARLVVPRGRCVWIRVCRGPNAGTRLLVDPRFHMDYVRGDYEPWTARFLLDCPVSH